MRFVFRPRPEHKCTQRKTFRMEIIMFLAINLLIEQLERLFYPHRTDETKTIRD
jgi:hypothetical protein